MGAPNNIEGMKSRKVWVMDIATMKMTRAIGGNEEKRANEDVREEAIRLMCIPGKRPVIVPMRIPIRRARISKNMKLNRKEKINRLLCYLNIRLNN